jgi:hypothetical protein
VSVGDGGRFSPLVFGGGVDIPGDAALAGEDALLIVSMIDDSIETDESRKMK